MLANSILRLFGREYFRFLTSEEEDLYLVGRIDALRDMIDSIELDEQASEIITKISSIVKKKYSFQTSKEMIDNWLNRNYA